MAVKLAINGYGRIGRNILRALYEGGRRDELQIVAVNDLGDAATNAHLTRFDTAHGRFPFDVSVDGQDLVVDGDRIRVCAERNPADLPWGELGVDVVLGPHVVQPDIVVAPRAAFSQRDLPTAPLLVVEVRSPSTGWLDEGRKRALYEESGVASYWLADPLAPSIAILELTRGRYAPVATAYGDQTIEIRAPFPMTLNPAGLARG